ncbi:alpha-L-fucosidase [[Ruminococcus] lactaris]|uniref:alpha-L-fucosidase n=1 Tax=[Ruminococcus] lactaris TaxID=46228 RepID=UPI001D037EE5|nr:alpha-L-fucosidase [[Ruminococcus] lactaris]MCB5538522.1 alpha-L-fucosidase [[Ruminococcus] lactaris]MCB5552421.1 alpha-L-fucosidase [[Ruminococcus] lactaris]MCB5737357.1 alpha-L-fucosidase [[Ruminococcus] lactaris]MCB5830535.1 alpha-L-fucosidase [[Ruminococcus] lactaris]MCB5845472.1 alpha-L-fucosidase [[Ruminococcus] lactaris]
MRKKALSMLMGLVLGVTTIFSSVGTTGVTVYAAENGVTDADCTDKDTAAPTPDDTVPDANQYKYQKDELAAFCHFGPNTFNELEWGFNQSTQKKLYEGRTPDEIFTLESDFDAETLVNTLKNAGFKKLIVTAKHHDGFCIWNSAHTEYDIASTSYKNGEGDILAEISEACTAANMDMGLYLSPWDVAESTFGSDGGSINNAYNEYYNNQLEEILSNPKYGNKGHFVEVWMDGANGYNNVPQTYNFEKWYATIQKYEGIEAGYKADCMLFGAGTHTTVRWIGNENGFADDTTWAKSTIRDGQIYNDDSQRTGDYKGDPTDGYSNGYEDGNHWTVPEADARITSGWFWGTQKNTPRTLTNLAEMYFRSVGHNATLLLNVPPNNEGKVDKAIQDRVVEFGQNVQDTFKTNLAKADGTTITASNVRGNDIDFKPGNAVDDDDATYWTTDNGTTSGSLTIKWDSAKRFDVVSIEEAIQNGQHINNYKVEYKENDNASWQTMESGVTVGSKRLIRTSPISATQVKITVGTSTGKVPQLSEVGVYKASKGFQLSGAAPDGMDSTSVNDKTKFKFSSSGWNPQTGPTYINGQNTWSNQADASFTYEFDGTKVYLMGTKDPNHGQADVYIDNMDTPVATIDTHDTVRSTGAKIFESADLKNGHHKLKLVAKTTAAIGVEAAYVINNDGKGMLEIENETYTMNEDSDLAVKIKRVGGTTGEITAKLEPNPGSAIQKHFDTELISTVQFANGESEKVISRAAHANRVPTTDGDVYFTLELSSSSPVIGLASSAKVTILDADAITRDSLNTLITESEGLKEHLYSEGWTAFAAALSSAKTVAANENATDTQIKNAYSTLYAAKEALVVRTQYTTDDRFQFPWKTGTSATLEAEFATEVTNSNDTDSDPDWPMHITDNSDASNGKFVTDMAYKDVITYAYHAEKAGTYHVVMRYRSGSMENEKNGIKITEANGKITEKTLEVNPTKENNNVVFGTAEFDIEVTEAGDGVISVTAPNTNKGPGIDYFIISPKNVTVESYDITATAGEGGTITAEGLADGKVSVTEGESATFTITANDGYEVSDVKVDGTSVGKRTSYTFENVTAAHTIEATFAFANYTAANPFEFPTTKGTTKTLEAEHATTITEACGATEWRCEVNSEAWASNGKYINSLNKTSTGADSVAYAYNAPVAGTYKVTVTYRSGSDTNKLAWSEQDGKITASQVATPNSKVNNVLQAKTVEFNMVVTTAGAGTLVFTAPDGDSPQTDKFDIELVKLADEADLTELQTAITNAEAILNAADKDKYSAAALVELQELVNAGKQLTTASSQADVDAKKAEITAKIADIQTQFTITATAGNGGKIAPTGATNVYKGTSKAFTITPNDGYHVDSLTVDGTAVDVVTEYTFSDVTANHTIAVTFAKDAMTVAKENLLAAINTANEKLAQTDAYTPASLEALQNAVDEAQTVYNKADATQTEVDNAKANVEAKIAALKEKADKSALRLAVKAAEGEAALTDKYTEESIAALQTAIDAANRVLADDNATQAEVDAQVEAVNAAKAALEEKKAPVVKEELEKAVADATEVVGATDKYTEASLAALQSAIDAANEVLQNSDATQDEIDAAVQAVKEARAALKAKDDDKKDDSNKDDDKKDDNNGSDNNGGNNNGNANNGSNNNGSFNNGSSNNGTANGTSNVAKAAKTGDTSNVAGMAMLCLAAGLVVVMAKRRRTN